MFLFRTVFAESKSVLSCPGTELTINMSPNSRVNALIHMGRVKARRLTKEFPEAYPDRQTFE